MSLTMRFRLAWRALFLTAAQLRCDHQGSGYYYRSKTTHYQICYRCGFRGIHENAL